MKKIMWYVAMIPVIVTSVVFTFIPDVIPMHYDLEGNVDRWGNKIESFIFPVVILAIVLFWQLLIRSFEKKEASAKDEKAQMEAKSNARLLGIVGVVQTAMFGIMHFVSLYSSCMQAKEGLEKTPIDSVKITCILLGVMLIILGNFMTKSKKNAMIGVRTSWSMYNDNTWRKSNHFGAISVIITGLLTIVTTIFVSDMVSTILMLVYLVVMTIVVVIYSKVICDKEKKNI